MSPVQRRDEVAGREPDDRRPVAVGLIAWLIATVIVATTAAIRQLPDGVLWTCLVGVALGIAGLVYTSRRARRS
ncbi:MAG: DUF2530 domain-containing protein [Naasia sp.]